MEQHVPPSDGHPPEPEGDRAGQLLVLPVLVPLHEGLELLHAELGSHEVAADEEGVGETLEQGRHLLQGLCLLVLGQVGLEQEKKKRNEIGGLKKIPFHDRRTYEILFLEMVPDGIHFLKARVFLAQGENEK